MGRSISDQDSGSGFSLTPLLDTDGRGQGAGFGLAEIELGETATQLTAVGHVMGTAAYMSPEQVAGETVDGQSDLWSLGVVIYEMVVGQTPFKGSSALAIMQAVVTASPAPIRTLRPDVAPELEQIVNRTLVRDRERRTITAGEVRDLAAGCLARLSSGSAAVVARPRPSRRARIAAAVVTLAVAAGAIATWSARSAKVRWARHEALPEIIRLAGADEFGKAYRLAQQAQPYIP